MLARLKWLRQLMSNYVGDCAHAVRSSWNTFWFTPADPASLCLIRVLAGLMLLYTHAIWTLDLDAFFGEHSWLSREVVARMFHDGYAWSILSWCRTPAALWLIHFVALITFAFLMLGLWTRIVSVLAFLFTVSYAHRTPGALYGLDQINGLLSLYLIIGPSGSRYSIDAWRARKGHRSAKAHPADLCEPRDALQWTSFIAKVLQPDLSQSSVTANIAIRLIQCHLCVIYLFAGLSKLQGLTWWNGFAFWGGIANQEYQTLDLTWLADWPLLINAMTHLTVAWEVSYCVLIWNRWTRPLVLIAAVFLHLGIVFALGMPTFGLAMLIANTAFVGPSFVRELIDGPCFDGADISSTNSRETHASSATPPPHFQRSNRNSTSARKNSGRSA